MLALHPAKFEAVFVLMAFGRMLAVREIEIRSVPVPRQVMA